MSCFQIHRQSLLEQGILLQTCDLPKSHLPLHKNCSAVAVFNLSNTSVTCIMVGTLGLKICPSLKDKYAKYCFTVLISSESAPTICILQVLFQNMI